MPVLLVTGEQDQKYREINSAMAERMPACETVIVPDAGHNVHLEKPAAYTALLRQFLTA
ncbi:MAG: hypothetical protein KJ052_11720 [Candidatus Hydrogenedentes bacterium]|nr:hypothetical protein [Candidatus Hydrogenedentota bacterium]